MTKYRKTFITLLLASLAGLVASVVLTVEKIHLLENPDAVLSCNFSLVLNCGVVMQTWQASVFGIPNSIIGIFTYPVAATLAVFALANMKISRKLMITAQVIAGLGLLFAYWLFFQSVYVIQVLCPWCLIVTFVTTLIFHSILHYNLSENVFNLRGDTKKKVQNFIKKSFDLLVLVSWVIFLIVLVIVKFGDSLFA